MQNHQKMLLLTLLVAALYQHRGTISESRWCCFDCDSDSETESDSWLLTDSDPDSWFAAATLDNVDSDSNSEFVPGFRSRGGAVPAPTPTQTAGS